MVGGAYKLDYIKLKNFQLSKELLKVKKKNKPTSEMKYLQHI